MRNASAAKAPGGRRVAKTSVTALVATGLFLAGCLLSPIGYDLMFRLGVQTGEVIFSWADGDRLESALPR